MKKIIRMIAICAMLFTSVFAVPASAAHIQEGSSATLTFDTPEQMAGYIIKNFDAMVNEVNADYAESTYQTQGTQVQEGYFQATSCVSQYVIPVLDSDEYVVCLDFDGDNGYMVCSNDMIMKFETEGDISYLDTYADIAYFSVVDDDFVYFEGDDYYVFGWES